MLKTDFPGLCRGLKRRVKQAQRDGEESVKLNIDYASNITKAFDELVRYYREAEKTKEGQE